jgi:phage gpG-like protein
MCYDWDTDMTLCIASLAQDCGRLRIVLCFDSKVAGEEFGSETEYKFHRLSGQICSMFAGSPGRAKELAWIYREFLRFNPLDKQRVIEQLREPIITMKRRLANGSCQEF